MLKKYYLSEMTISSRHGGGLTLMRVLGDELEEFTNFIRPVPYPVEGFENIAEVERKELKLWKNPGGFQAKPMPARFTRPYFANQFMRLLNLPNPEYLDRDYYQKYYTDYVARNTDVRNGRYLVVPQNIHAVILANALHRKFGIAYASWVMDDHLVRYDAGPNGYHYSYPKNFEREFGYHLQNARHVFTISPGMGKFYKRRFGVDSTVLFSPTDPVCAPLEGKGPRNDLRFCHFGRVWKWPMDAVQRFATQLDFLNATLDIYSHFPLEGALLDNPRVVVRKPVAPDEVTAKMREYDAVTIFYGMDEEVHHLSAFNISTKMSECLASGLPVLFVGPDYGAMTHWARSQGCGVIVTEPENKDQLSSVSRLNDPLFARNVAATCLEVSKQFTSTRAMKQVWRDGWNKVLKD